MDKIICRITEINPSVARQLMRIPAYAVVLYKQLTPKLQYLIQQSFFDYPFFDIDKQNEFEIQISYLINQDISKAEQKQLLDLQVATSINNKLKINSVFVTSLDIALSQTSIFFSRVNLTQNQCGDKVVFDFNVRDPCALQFKQIGQFAAENMGHDDQLFKEFVSGETFATVVHWLLELKKDERHLQDFLRLIKLRKSEALAQKFVMGDSPMQVRIVLQQLATVLLEEKSYKEFNRIISSVKQQGDPLADFIQERRSDDREATLQLEFLFQLINMPMNSAICFELTQVSMFFNVLYFLNRLGLLHLHIVEQKIWVVPLNILSLQQFSINDQMNYSKIFQFKQNYEQKPIYVESTGRITYYKNSNVKQNQSELGDQVNIQLLSLFCRPVYNMPHAIIFELSRDVIQNKQVEASLIAKFLTNQSQKPVPADLINLLDSWESKTMYSIEPKIKVMKLSPDFDQQALSYMQYYLLYDYCQSKHYLIWGDEGYFDQLVKSAECYYSVVLGQPRNISSSQFESAQKKLKELTNGVKIIIVRSDVIPDIEAAIEKMQKELQWVNCEATIKRVFK